MDTTDHRPNTKGDTLKPWRQLIACCVKGSPDKLDARFRAGHAIFIVSRCAAHLSCAPPSSGWEGKHITQREKRERIYKNYQRNLTRMLIYFITGNPLRANDFYFYVCENYCSNYGSLSSNMNISILSPFSQFAPNQTMQLDLL